MKTICLWTLRSGWLDAQIAGTRGVAEPLRALPSSAHVFESFTEFQEAGRKARNAAKAEGELAKQFVNTVREKLAPTHLYHTLLARRCTDIRI